MKKLLIKIYIYFILLIKPFKIKKGFIGSNQTIKEACDKTKSIIRFGDGEFRIMFAHKGIHYQDYDKNLAKELKKIFLNYEINSEYLVCVPSVFFQNIGWFLKQDKKYAYCFAAPRNHFRKIMKRNLNYGDAFCFSQGKVEEYLKLWKEAKHLIVIHNDKKWAKMLEINSCKVSFVEIPSKNSYEQIDEIEEKIINIKKKFNDAKILISAGPMAKVLVYRLSKKNIVSYDVGHCFDEPLENL